MDHIGIDLGARESQICVRTSDAAIVDERRWPTARLDSYLKERPAARVVLETSAEAFRVADQAVSCGHEVKVVPSLLVRSLGVGSRGVKNDRKDAQVTSAASCRIDLPSVHIPSRPARELKALCTSREALVESRTKLVNTVRSWMRTQLESVRNGTPATFPDRVRKKLLEEPEGMPAHIERLLAVIDTLNEQIKEADKELGHLTKGHEICSLLMTVPGVGPVTAARFVACVDEVERFANAHELESYLGLTPGENVTGFKGHRTHLTKAGQPKVRWTLVQASWSAMRTRPLDPMVVWAQRIAQRRGRAISAVALARKMAGILYAMWRDRTTYSPSRGATQVMSNETPA